MNSNGNGVRPARNNRLYRLTRDGKLSRKFVRIWRCVDTIRYGMYVVEDARGNSYNCVAGDGENSWHEVKTSAFNN